MIKVLIVDDQSLTHRLIKIYLRSESNIKIIGFANNGREAIDKIVQLQPDIVLMDVEMPEMDGLNATKIITQKFSQVKVLILTVYDNEHHLSTAIKNGARGYLLKTTASQELINAVINVHQGYFSLSIELTEKYLKKIVISQSEVEQISDVKRKVNYLYRSLNKLDEKVQGSYTGDWEKQVEPKIASMLQDEMALLRDRDSHLQFKVDRMKYNQEKLEKNVRYMFKVQIVCIVLLLVTFGYLVFSSLKWLY